jgi:hypothetical protein
VLQQHKRVDPPQGWLILQAVCIGQLQSGGPLLIRHTTYVQDAGMQHMGWHATQGATSLSSRVCSCFILAACLHLVCTSSRGCLFLMFLHSRPWRWLHDRAWLQGTACVLRGEGVDKAWGHGMCAAPLLPWVPAACAIRCCSCPLTGSLLGSQSAGPQWSRFTYSHPTFVVAWRSVAVRAVNCMRCTQAGAVLRLWVLLIVIQS